MSLHCHPRGARIHARTLVTSGAGHPAHAPVRYRAIEAPTGSRALALLPPHERTRRERNASGGRSQPTSFPGRWNSPLEREEGGASGVSDGEPSCSTNGPANQRIAGARTRLRMGGSRVLHGSARLGKSAAEASGGSFEVGRGAFGDAAEFPAGPAACGERPPCSGGGSSCGGGGQSPEPGLGEKCASSLPLTPSHCLASAGASFFWVMLGQVLA
jgi:hypothetical protein